MSFDWNFWSKLDTAWIFPSPYFHGAVNASYNPSKAEISCRIYHIDIQTDRNAFGRAPCELNNFGKSFHKSHTGNFAWNCDWANEAWTWFYRNTPSNADTVQVWVFQCALYAGDLLNSFPIWICGDSRGTGIQFDASALQCEVPRSICFSVVCHKYRTRTFCLFL
jgi:hypothetical protein